MKLPSVKFLLKPTHPSRQTNYSFYSSQNGKYLNSVWVFSFFNFIFLLELISERRHEISRARRNIVELNTWLIKSF